MICSNRAWVTASEHTAPLSQKVYSGKWCPGAILILLDAGAVRLDSEQVQPLIADQMTHRFVPVHDGVD